MGYRSVAEGVLMPTSMLAWREDSDMTSDLMSVARMTRAGSSAPRGAGQARGTTLSKRLMP
ncbi:hypothetical protein BE15_21510 [Sorangium cellulosum]|uniref:Uncharacterized protein n=1 Tax=Sorangium cellulosum TaxID=56 RepID=A0A150QLR4_SORCE|nr:hypothetical protein BE15_21510 [Sorangium cellulosum]